MENILEFGRRKKKETPPPAEEPLKVRGLDYSFLSKKDHKVAEYKRLNLVGMAYCAYMAEENKLPPEVEEHRDLFVRYYHALSKFEKRQCSRFVDKQIAADRRPTVKGILAAVDYAKAWEAKQK
jgi:hypothetical protein